MRFTKMHGLGNDYLYVYGEAPNNVAALSQKLSDRHFGVGSDGMIYISPSATADCKMRIFNAGGSEAKMCGNGIRCVGKYVYDKGYTDKTVLTVETLSGVKTLRLYTLGGRVTGVSVNMGKAVVEQEKTLCVDGQQIRYIPVNVGNPHAVVFVEHVTDVPLETLGPRIERHSDFPGGVNVEFVERLSDTALRMRVWERGSGVTMACGTGACASAAAAVSAGLCTRDADIAMHLDGGRLTVRVGADNELLMTGPAATVCECEVAQI